MTGGKTDGERLAVVEQRVESLHEWAKEFKDAVAAAAKSNSAAIEKLTAVVVELAGIKSDHERHSVEISGLRRRQHELGNEMGRLDQHDIKLGYIDRDMGKLSSAVAIIKNALPNMELASGWVFKAALWVMAGLGSVALAVIFNGFAGGGG